jgi:hypothetical protein
VGAHRPAHSVDTRHSYCPPAAAADGLDVIADAQIMDGLKQNLDFVLAGSILGTLLFYAALSLLLRAREGRRSGAGQGRP